MIAKRLDSPYMPGRRTTRLGQGQEHLLAPTSWSAAGSPGEGGRSGRLGALVIGIPDDDGELRYAGRVGTGFTRGRADAAAAAAGELARADSPFTGRQPPKLTHFVEPELVARVDYTRA